MNRFLLLLALAFPAFAAKTTVTDVLVKTNGGFCSGTISIQNPAFTSIDGPIAAATVTANIKSNNGTFTIALEPGPFYTATYVVAPSGCTPTVEFWVVPISATPVDLAMVRSTAPPPPLPNTIPLSYITQSGAVLNDCAKWNGTNWAPASSCGGGGGSGTVTSIAFSNPLTGGTITTSGTVGLGNIPVTNLASGIGASSSTFWRGDGTWALGVGSVTVVGSGTLSSGACVAGGGLQEVQTPSVNCTIDSSGNLGATSISTGAGSGVAGAIELTQGTAPLLGTTSVKIYAPVSVTSYALVPPSAAATGIVHATNSANVDTLSISSVVSADLNITTTTCTNQFLTAISATGTGTCTTATLASAQFANQGTTVTVLHGNGAGNPSFGAVSLTADITGTLAAGNGGTGITSLGTGVATALGTAVSGTGAICLASGSACSGGATNITVGTSTITSGTTTSVLFDNAGVLGEYVISGTGNVCMTTSCSMTTPVLGTPTSGVMTNVTGTATGLTSGITNALKSATTTVDVSAATAPTSGQVLTATAGTTATWQTPSGGGASITQGTFASLPATCTTNDLYLITDSQYTARCSSANTWSFFIDGYGLVVPPPSSSWSWDNQGSATIDSTNGYEYLSIPRLGAVSATWRYRTAPGTPWTLTVLVRVDHSGAPPGVSGDTLNSALQLVMRQSTTGKAVTYRIGSSANPYSMVTDKWNSSTSFSAGYTTYDAGAGGNTDIVPTSHSLMWYRVADNGTNLLFSWSVDGQHWNQFDSQARGNFLTISGGVTGPDQIGFGAYANTSAVKIAIISWSLT